MNFHYYFRHMSSSDALKYDFERKLAGMESLIQTTKPIHVTFSVDAAVHKVHVGLHAANNGVIEVEEMSDDMYKSLDRVIDSLHRQLAREKERIRQYPKQDPYQGLEGAPAEDADSLLDDEALASN